MPLGRKRKRLVGGAGRRGQRSSAFELIEDVAVPVIADKGRLQAAHQRVFGGWFPSRMPYKMPLEG